jgi:hypothetical protein
MRLGAMSKAADALVLGLHDGGSAATDRLARILLEELRALVPELARERPCGGTVIRVTLAGFADHIARAADAASGWRSPARRPIASETLVRALIARLRLVARN